MSRARFCPRSVGFAMPGGTSHAILGFANEPACSTSLVCTHRDQQLQLCSELRHSTLPIFNTPSVTVSSKAPPLPPTSSCSVNQAPGIHPGSGFSCAALAKKTPLRQLQCLANPTAPALPRAGAPAAGHSWAVMPEGLTRQVLC